MLMLSPENKVKVKPIVYSNDFSGSTIRSKSETINKPFGIKQLLNLGDFSWCIHKLDNDRKICQRDNEVPNPIEDPNENWGTFFTWFSTPKGSGKFVTCWKESWENFLACLSEGTHSVGCVNNYTDGDGRKHAFPCSGKCIFTPDEMAAIQGCDQSKGIVTQGCNIFAQDFCQCPSGSVWNKSLNKCVCTNQSYVTYYGFRRADQTYGRGYCAPMCPEGYIFDPDPSVNVCVREPAWY